jgi:hypothetical protein
MKLTILPRLLGSLPLLTLGGCLWYSSPAPQVRGEGDTYNKMHRADRGTTPADVQRQLANRTLLYAPSAASPSQILYAGADGRGVLWYPGQQHLFAGEWKIDAGPTPYHHSKEQVTMLCVRYADPPVHYADWAQWTCRPAGRFLAQVRESAEGDVLGLTGRRDAPFVLGQTQTTLAAVRTRLQQHSSR